MEIVDKKTSINQSEHQDNPRLFKQSTIIWKWRSCNSKKNRNIDISKKIRRKEREFNISRKTDKTTKQETNKFAIKM